MLLDLKEIFLNEGSSRDFDCEVDMSNVNIGIFYPFISPVGVKANVSNHAGLVLLKINVSFEFSYPCDRCAVNTQKSFNYKFEHTLSLASEESSEYGNDYLSVPNYELELYDVIKDDVLLELPSKILCSPSCKGLCPKCGKNLNEGMCNCTVRTVDSRLEALRALLIEE